MKKDIFRTAIYKIRPMHLLLIIGMMATFTSCKDEVVVYRTETKEMMGDYLERIQQEKGQFSEFNKMLDTTKVMGLLKAYGEYTCFAPTNDAFYVFYKSQGRKSMEDFPLDTLKQIVFNQIIKGIIITTDKFKYGSLPVLSMNDRYITIDTIINNHFIANKTSTIIEENQLVNNGVLHVINEVFNPTQLTSIEAIAKEERFKLFYEALQITRLTDKLLLTKDDSYNPEDYKAMVASPFTQGGGSVDQLPESKKYGFTLLMESDATYKSKYGIETIEQLKAKAKAIYDEVYPEDKEITDITNPRNSLNRFVAYHLINKRMRYSQFINDYDSPHMLKNYDMFEYIETMCPNTLMEVRIVRTLPFSNLINMINDPSDAVQINLNYKDKDATNGSFHEIDKILAYDINVSTHMSSIRLRMDAASFFPELTNNNMRGYLGTKQSDVKSWIFPKGYIQRLTTAEGTVFTYLNSCGDYLDYQGDEVYLKGMYDFSVVTPPIPAGNYEVRFGYQPTGGRGVAQLYFDNEPCGIPLDLRVDANLPSIGYIAPDSKNLDDPFGYENDKMMRNRGYMKGPCTYQDVSGRWYEKKIARNSNRYLRKILGIYNFDKAGTHVFKVKSVKDGQFMFDFLEFIPVGLIESEGVD